MLRLLALLGPLLACAHFRPQPTFDHKGLEAHEGHLLVPFYQEFSLGDHSPLNFSPSQMEAGGLESKLWQNTFNSRLAAYSRRWVSIASVRRKGPSYQARKLGKLALGDMVWVQAVTGSWAQLKSGGFVPLANLSHSPPAHWQEGLSP